jgi:hypothetical protein
MHDSRVRPFQVRAAASGWGHTTKRHPLVTEISLALVLKLVALTAIFYLFFGPAERMLVNSDVVARHLLSPDAGNKGNHP